GTALSLVLSTLLTYFFGLPASKESPSANPGIAPETAEIVILSPLQGKVIDIAEIRDPTFASGLLGNGVGIIPTSGKVIAP
ncbi:PTS glucose transporter subunit IIA, partial [Klebsiella pneumoniae]